MNLKIWLFGGWVSINLDSRHKRFVEQFDSNSQLIATLGANHITGVMNINDAIDNIKKFTYDQVDDK